MPRMIRDNATAIRALLQILDNTTDSTTNIRLAMPLGIGKPNVLVNALYEHIRADQQRSLDIFTALSLLKPQGHSELERRFLDPLVERLYGNYPDLQYALDMQAGTLPANISVHEFFLKSGDWLHNPHAQQHYISSNYTHIARDMLAQRPNLLLQAVAAREQDGMLQLSLSCNPDVTLDLLQAKKDGRCNLLCVAVINRELPFMPGSAIAALDDFDLVIDDPANTHMLFNTPNMRVGLADHAIGLYASSLVQDGGTLQIGIGSLGDAIAHTLLLRHEQQPVYQTLLQALNRSAMSPAAHSDQFRAGLYGCSEMLVNGLLQLLLRGVICRPADHDNAVVLHGGFFIGPAAFYESLRTLDDATLARIDMAGIRFINHLYGDSYADEPRKRAQRRKAAFINTCMMVTLSGAAVSDGLEDGSVVSGVGGQYNFVAMAHELNDARSILMLRSWRMSDGKAQSNIVTHYGHCTIPRHLRDIVITEYGIADLRGKSDSEVIAALLNIADSRFQPALQAWAIEHGKLPETYCIPEAFCRNTPETLRERLQPFAQQLPDFPFGHDFTDDELVIMQALGKLKASSEHPVELLGNIVRALLSDNEAPEQYLSRMGLAETRSVKEKLLRKIFAGNL